MSLLGFTCKHHADYRPQMNNKAVGSSNGVADCLSWDTGQRTKWCVQDTSYSKQDMKKSDCWQPSCPGLPQPSDCNTRKPQINSCYEKPTPDQGCQRNEEAVKANDRADVCATQPMVSSWVGDNVCSSPEEPPMCVQVEPCEKIIYPSKCGIPQCPETFVDAYCKARSLFYQNANCSYNPKIERQIRYYLATKQNRRDYNSMKKEEQRCEDIVKTCQNQAKSIVDKCKKTRPKCKGPCPSYVCYPRPTFHSSSICDPQPSTGGGGTTCPGMKLASPRRMACGRPSGYRPACKYGNQKPVCGEMVDYSHLMCPPPDPFGSKENDIKFL